MYGILIDPDTQEVTDIEFPGGLHAYYELLDCDLIDRYPYDDDNDIVLDDEGLYKNHENFFSIEIEGTPYFFVGKSVIVGVNHDNGDWTDPINLTASDVKVKFYKKEKAEE